MALDASQMLDTPQRAGVKVNPRGTSKRLAIGGLAGEALMRRRSATSETPSFGRLAYLAVTDDELVLIKLTGAAKVRLDEIIARVPLAEVQSAELGRGLALPLTISFTDGGSWLLEVPRLNGRDGGAVVAELAQRGRRSNGVTGEAAPEY